jgi:hypothetical protein
MIGLWFFLFLTKMQFLLSLHANILSHWELTQGTRTSTEQSFHPAPWIVFCFSNGVYIRDKCALFAISLVQCHKLRAPMFIR